MKIKALKKEYDEVMSLPKEPRKKPKRPNFFFRTLMKVLSAPELRSLNFKCRKTGMDRLGKGEPCLYLMNHSAFIDLKIAMSLLYPRPINIVCTTDAFVGQSWLLRSIGCIPAKKFVTDFSLVKDVKYALDKLKDSILMYPEASYTFDGTATPLPDTLGKFIKSLGIPVVMIRTYGAFARDPLYNNLKLRKVDVSADMDYILSPEEIKEMDSDEILRIINDRFTFDNFKWQKESGVKITEPFRADYLNRVLYKCPCCGVEGKMTGSGTTLRCLSCGKEYELTEDGEMCAQNGETEFSHIPDWYNFERESVKEEILNGTYSLKVPVDIAMMVDTKAVYMVGEGELAHDREGFRLEGCGGKLSYSQKPLASYSLYADYNWYEIGDVICIGGGDVFYYCFPKGAGDVVAKTRLATEELYKIVRAEKRGAALTEQ